jgi:hypothetical protein
MPDPNTPPVQNPPNPESNNPPAGDPPVVPNPPAAAAVPEKYELKLADKSALDATDVEKISAYAKEHKLTQEQATALLKHQEATASGLVTRHDAARQTERDGWLTAVQTDKELGGEKLSETIKLSKLAMDKFAPGETHPFRQHLNETGLGNHPDVVRTMVMIGKAMAEDKPLGGLTAPEGKKTLAERMYPDLKK